jgi:hypothetical protein
MECINNDFTFGAGAAKKHLTGNRINRNGIRFSIAIENPDAL